jgi:hypothetical protein
VTALAAVAGLVAYGCTDRVEETFERMNDVETRLEQEIEGLRGDMRLLRTHWDVSEVEEATERHREELFALVRERFRIQDAYRKGEAGKVDTIRAASDFLSRASDLLETVETRRGHMLAMQEMSDSAARGIIEITTRLSEAEAEIKRIPDEKRRLLMESRLAAIRDATGKAQPLVQAGMQDVQKDADKARVVFEAGMKKFEEIERTLEALLRDVRDAIDEVRNR